ncbi:MAG: right-handed parallel beta-helix repeat-containing protein, partial [Bacteroidetes bacterium]
LFASAGNNIRVINNILAHSGSGYGYYTSSATNIINSDHNNVYVPNGIFGYWNNANVSNLENWQAVSGFDANSLALDPIFVSDTDLHVNQISLHKAGIFVGITEDIDGDERDLVTPDIGADEFDLPALDVAMVSIDEPAMPFASGNTDVVVTFKNNGTQTLNSLFLLWSVNGESQSNYQWTGELAAGQSTQATIGAFDFQLGTPYEIVVRSSTPNGQSDQLPINDTTRVENLYAAFEGIFTIGGNNPDFASFTEASDVLNVGGVTGPVTFNVRPGEYEEQIEFNLFPGASEENRVTFQSESEDNTAVNLRFNSSSGSNYIIHLDGARFLTFKGMTFEALNSSQARIADINGTTSNVSFVNNRFLGVPTTNISTIRALVFSNSEPFSHIQFEGNYFENGSYAFYMIGSSNQPGTLIHQNQFSGQYRYGLFLRNHTAPQVTENTLETETVHGNYYAIYLESSPGASDVSRNRIFGQNNGRGIGFWSSNGGAERSLVSNNFIQIGTTNAVDGIYMQNSNDVDIVYNTVNVVSSSVSASHAALLEWSQNLLIKNNIFASTSGAYAISFTPTSYAFTSDHNNLYTTGNILGSFGGDIADLVSWQNQTGRDASSLSVDPLFVSETDLYINQNALVGAATPFEKVLVDIDNNTRDPQAPVIGAHELTTATEDAAITELVAPAVPFSEGVNEVEVTLLNNALNPLSEVTINWSVNDLEQAPFQWHGNLAPGATQQVNIGEFNFLSGEPYNVIVFSSMPNGLEDQRPQNDTIWVEGLYAGLNGTYSIGGELADFENFTQAIQALNDGGVAGPVTFMVADGTYNEQLVLNEIAGASQENTITFKGESAVLEAVIVEFDAGSQPNYTLRLNNTSHVRFEWITFNSLNTSNARVVSLGGELSGISFHRSVFRGRTGSSTNSNHALVHGDVIRLTHVQFTENLFFDGSYGVQLSGNSSNTDQAVVFEGNAFRDQHHMAVNLTHVTAPEVHKNIFTSPDAGNNYYGVYLSNTNEGARVTANRIYDISGGYGILITGSGSSLNRGNILNNFVEISGTGTTHGIHITSSSRFNIYHNTVNITGTHGSSGRAFHISLGANNLLRNNVFANTGGGYAIYVNTSGSLSSSDFNNLYTTGSVLGYWNNGNVADFVDWKSQSGQDSNSLNLDPGFINEFSPMLSQASLSTAGIALADVTTDIDGNPRSPVNPSMGAVEFLPLNQHDAAVAEFLAPQAPFAAGEQEVMVRIRNNGAQELTSLTFQWTVNGQPQAELVWTGELLTGQEESVVVGSFDFQEATRYKIFVQSVNPNGEPDEDASNNSMEVENVFPALAGSYTLGGTTADFSSLGLAADNLNFGGILDDVDILVNAGTFNHQLHLKAYPGMSSDRRVTFRSADSDSTQVVLFYTASSNAENYTVFLDGASYVTFENLTLEARDNNRSIVVELANNARNNIFTGNIFKGVVSPNNSSGRALVYAPSSSGNNLLLEGNLFLDGSMGVYLSGGNRTGIVVKNNVFTNQYGYGV